MHLEAQARFTRRRSAGNRLTLCVERRKLVGVSAGRLRDALGAMTALHVPTRGRMRPRWRRDGPQSPHREEQGESQVWRATAPVEGAEAHASEGALFRAEIRPVAPLWSEVVVQIEYIPGAGPLAWLAARTALRWRLGAGLDDLVRAMGRCTAPAWARVPARRARTAARVPAPARACPEALRPAV